MRVFERFTQDARRIVGDATEIARETGSPAVEAEHLLLAATRHEDPVSRVLRDYGLDYDGLSEALGRETERNLATVGVTADPPAFSPYIEKPRLATSAKAALEQSLRIAVERGDKRIGGEHVVLGVLRPEHGTVPRALVLAGVDRDALRTALT